MDFETHYTPEQEQQRVRLRAEVRAWLPAHIDGVGGPPDAADLTFGQFQRNRAFHRALGERGWYAPTWPREHGGGGLDRVVAPVIREEMARAIPHLESVHAPGDIGGSVASALRYVGTDEQRERFLPSILRGEVITWELHTEPEAGSDLPSLRSTARREGDTYMINGTKTLVGGHFEADQHFFLAVTDPQAPRRQNLSAFLIPEDAAGITVTDMDMIAGSMKRMMHFEDVRVPASNMIGGPGDGWRAFETSLFEALTVGIGPNLDRDGDVLDQLIEHCRAGVNPPHVQDALARAYAGYQVQRLFRLRNEWMASANAPITYEGAQVALGRKNYDFELAEALHSAVGPLAMIKDPAWAPAGGDLEYFHRYAILMAHPGGTVEIQKLRMFRGMAAAHRPGG